MFPQGGDSYGFHNELNYVQIYVHFFVHSNEFVNNPSLLDNKVIPGSCNSIAVGGSDVDLIAKINVGDI